MVKHLAGFFHEQNWTSLDFTIFKKKFVDNIFYTGIIIIIITWNVTHNTEKTAV